jgi:hypothetical protein
MIGPNGLGLKHGKKGRTRIMPESDKKENTGSSDGGGETRTADSKPNPYSSDPPPSGAGNGSKKEG